MFVSSERDLRYHRPITGEPSNPARTAFRHCSTRILMGTTNCEVVRRPERHNSDVPPSQYPGRIRDADLRFCLVIPVPRDGLFRSRRKNQCPPAAELSDTHRRSSSGLLGLKMLISGALTFHQFPALGTPARSWRQFKWSHRKY